MFDKKLTVSALLIRRTRLLQSVKFKAGDLFNIKLSVLVSKGACRIQAQVELIHLLDCTKTVTLDPT